MTDEEKKKEQEKLASGAQTYKAYRGDGPSDTAGETAGGAMAGFQMGGPWGAAIGGGVGMIKGILAERQAKKQAQAAAQSGFYEAKADIEGKKVDRINNAISGLMNSFTANFRR